MEIAFKVRVKGRVTGVGFRFSTQIKAAEFPGLRGYVRNVTFGEVEVFLQGPPDEVNAMLRWLHKGPDWARVDSLHKIEEPVNPALSGFNIR